MTCYPNIQLRKSPHRYNWFEVTEDCEVPTGTLQRLIIPKGYQTDFATIPRLLWPILPPHGRMANASIVHDFVYDTRFGEKQYGEKTARLSADIDFAIRCLEAGVPEWQMVLTYCFVRLFGRKWWRN